MYETGARVTAGRTCYSFPDNGRVLSSLAAAAGPIRQLINPLAGTPRPRRPLLTYHPKTTTPLSK